MQKHVDAGAPPSGGTRAKGRVAILDAALALFAESGYGGVSLRDIARRAQVSLTLVDHHFGAKHELFDGLVQSLQSEVEACLGPLRSLRAEAAGGDVDARALDALLASISLLADRQQGRHLVWLILRSRYENDPRVSAALITLFKPIAQAFVDSLQPAHPRLSREDLAWVFLLALAPLVERRHGYDWVHAIADLAPAARPELDPGITRAYILAGVRGYLAEAERRAG